MYQFLKCLFQNFDCLNYFLNQLLFVFVIKVIGCLHQFPLFYVANNNLNSPYINLLIIKDK